MKKLNFPTILTLARIGVIPFMVIFFYIPLPGHRLLSAFCFALAGVTDWLDGYLARKNKLTSPFGAFLDPVADKLLIATALVLITQAQNAFWVTIPAAIIIGREITISALREWMAELGKRTNVAVSYIGKVKTVAQLFALGALLAYRPPIWPWLNWLGLLLLYVAAILTVWSGTIYIRAAWPELMAGLGAKSEE